MRKMRRVGALLRMLLSCTADSHLLLCCAVLFCLCRVAVISLVTRRMRKVVALLQMLLDSTADSHLLLCCAALFCLFRVAVTTLVTMRMRRVGALQMMMSCTGGGPLTRKRR
jgi:hypothetical protein